MAEGYTPPAEKVLFCPFCLESFEGTLSCPDHELALVPLERLPADPEAAASENEALPLHSLGLGRWGVFAATLLLLVSFFMLPMIATQTGQAPPQSATAHQIASSVAPNLWAIPVAAFALFSVLARRRTPRRMRGARLAVAAIGVLPLVSLGLTLSRIFRGAEEQSLGIRQAVQVHATYGSWGIAAGGVFALVAGFLFGRAPAAR